MDGDDRSQEAFRKFGYNERIGTNETYVGAIGGKEPWRPISPAVLEVVSDLAADAGVGAGAREVKFLGLDSNFREINEIVALDGLTVVPTTQSFIRLHRAYVVATGTYGKTNQGKITIRAGSSTVGTIVEGFGQTQLSGYCVPARKRLFVSNVNATTDPAVAMDLRFWQSPHANDVTSPFSGAKRIVQQYDGLSGPAPFPYSPELEFEAYTDIWFSAVVNPRPTATVGPVSAEYVGTLVG